MTWPRLAAAALAGGCVLNAMPALAQAPGEGAGRVELSIGALWIGREAVGARDATETAAGGGRFRLFSTESALAGAPGLMLRIGRRLTGIVEAEVAASYSRPRLTTTVTGDVENAAAASVSESTTQLTLEGGALISAARWRFGPRVLPFVVGGGGYLRQLHEGQTLVESGHLVYAGAGVRIPLTSAGARSRRVQVGLRVDARAVARSGGVVFDGRSHTSPSVTVSMSARF